MNALSDKSKMTIGFGLTLAGFIAGGAVVKDRQDRIELRTAATEISLVQCREQWSDQRTETALLKQSLGVMNETMKEMRDDVRGVARSVAAGGRP